MPEMGLIKRVQHRPDPLVVLEAVREFTAAGPNSIASTRAVTRAMRVTRGLNAIRADVAEAQDILAPELVEDRRTGRLQRRTYQSEGSNYLWHIDGYDKLAPFGLPIHGCVDGFSRYILWLKLGTTNRRPEQTCLYFLEAVSKYCLPHSIRVDAGTENSNIKYAQVFLSDGLPRLTPLNHVLVGSSNHNERIERFWGLLRTQKINYWINHFKRFVANGEMVAWDDVDRNVSYYVYNHLIRSVLDEMTSEHNDHRIRRQKNPDIVHGKPLLMYVRPEDFGHRDCGRQPEEIHIDMAKTRLAADVPFDEDVRVVFEQILQQAHIPYPPQDLAEADAMYRHLRAEAHAHYD